MIDGENVPPRFIPPVLLAARQYGRLAVKRVYGGSSLLDSPKWQECVKLNSLELKRQLIYTQGKNATDIFMAVDAMDLMHKRRFSTFCIVSSDRDFIPLIRRLREEGIRVYGYGMRSGFINKQLEHACDDFTYIDSLSAPSSKATVNGGPDARLGNAPKTTGDVLKTTGNAPKTTRKARKRTRKAPKPTVKQYHDPTALAGIKKPANGRPRSKLLFM